MKLMYITDPLNEIAVDSLVIFLSEYDSISAKVLKELDAATRGAISTLLAPEEFTGREKQVTSILQPEGFAAKRVILVGVGSKKDVAPDAYRRAAGYLSRFAGLTSSESAVFYLDAMHDRDYYQAVIEGYLLGSFVHLDFKSGDDAKSKNKLERLYFRVDNKTSLKKVEKAVERGRVVAEGQLLMRRLANTPANHLPPRKLAAEAQKLARQYALRCTVLDEKAIKQEKMGALLAVAQGSIEPPRFIVLEYNGAREGQKPIVLVGKGVTFDAGGISLKAALNMHEMKSDMSGAAAVLATIITAARLQVPRNIIALIPATENLPSGSAIKPGDIITARKGKTIEIINTDAEGRLILADALDYADKFEPQAVIDIATLTGASLYILGYSGAPVLGNNDNLLQRIKDASQATAERVWGLPIWDDHRDQMKSSVADLVNSGGKPAGTIAAAAFLENFIGDWPWAHIDIAYVDMEPKGRAYVPKGTTGFGVRLLTELLSNWKKL